MLPMDYQYYIGAWIYKVIGSANHEFASFLHSEGYRDGNKQFKLFNYSPLDFGRPKLWKERSLFELLTDKVFLNVSFSLNEAAENFIIGLFNNQEVYMGNQFNGIDFLVTQVERLADRAIQNTMIYRAASPVVVSYLAETEKYARYLAPDDDHYSELLRQHLAQKYSTIPSAKPIRGDYEFGFKLLNTPKSKLATIKPDTPQQSKVRGYVYDFEMTAPPEIHNLILNAGLGEKNATGFGWVEIK
jgi:CRISPR-associated endoribonuclease Cas6